MVVILQAVFLALALSGLTEAAEESEVAAQLLKELGLGPLWQGSPARAPVAVRKEFERLQSVNPSRAVSAVHACPERGNSSERPALVFSVLPSPAAPSLLLSAELQLFVGPEQLAHRDLMVRVFQVVSGQPLGQPDAHRLLSVQQTPSTFPAEGLWLSFNVLAAVTDWLTAARPNLGLLVPEAADVPEGAHRPLLLLTFGPGQQGSPPEVPFEVSGWPHSAVVDAPLGPAPCARRPWLLDFSRWGLLGPLSLDVGACSGRCTGGGAEHTALLGLLADEGPCCVPADYRPAPTLYREANGNFVVKVLPRVAVTSCVCR